VEERRRIEEAMVGLIAERGYHGSDLERLLSRAGTSRGRFEAHFADFDACFAALWDSCRHEVIARTSLAYLSEPDWRSGIRAGTWQLCRWAQENPDRARILFVEAEFAAEAVRASRDVTFARYAQLIHLGNLEREGSPLPEDTGHALMGAIWDRFSKSVKAGAFDQLPSQVPELMYVVVLPYLGGRPLARSCGVGPMIAPVTKQTRFRLGTGDRSKR
jgi:AcrR family transcriptional regulator